MSTKRNQNEVDNFGTLYLTVYNDQYQMQTFTPVAGYDLDYIVLEGKRVNNCVSVDVDIFLADGSHKPIGTTKGTKQLLQAVIGTSEAQITFTFDSAITLTTGQEYCIVVSCAGANSGNNFSWSRGFSNTGFRAVSTNAGSSWSTPTAADGVWFQAWGSDSLTEVTLTPQASQSRLVAIGNDEVWYEDI